LLKLMCTFGEKSFSGLDGRSVGRLGYFRQARDFLCRPVGAGPHWPVPFVSYLGLEGKSFFLA
jgi:hypothetical protein